ncbi:FAD-binding oxidoreductase [Burkholderia ubonensis]|uniref:FAD-binding oxidoreductase n=1 Tax=Burkholderia ubonensis TaxID=101571 RepID=UPI0007572ED4|nr:FAD-binding oxidoreductase [Burkholderia ubonensis]KVL76460.1 hypothetical protein WJ48_33035 [Burkholderia ubonensis]KVL81022.1 hypothetical protein WJ49_03920 [Burkholderia ubonensis]KVL97742.1 hypothetical protein WJ50_03415 [Burkholderia ubonensis]KVR16051.1 hypothetical protein WK13_10040 [Burkholderia ubonensis]
MSNSNAAQLRAALCGVLDEAGFIDGHEAGARYCEDFSGGRGEPVAVLRPKTPAEVAAVMKILHALNQPVVIQGGMTGLVGACVPQPGEAVMSLERLNRIEEIDAVGCTMVVQAGVCLESVHEAAAASGLLFPVDIGSRGSCQIGGMIATNAGGNRVLRYGMMRNAVLGLEAVLADGTVISRMGKVLKDNAGYDLKHLFIGSEGTLGVVTRAVLSLQPLPASRRTALVSVNGFGEVIALLQTCRRRLGASLTSFEVMWRDYYDTVTQELKIGKPAFARPGSHLIVVETMSTQLDDDESPLTDVLGDFLEASDGADAIIACSLAEADALWALREASGEAANAIAPWVGFDVSLPIADMERWVSDIHAQLRALGTVRMQTYGHLGDGNLHLVAGGTPDDAGFAARVSPCVHRSVGALGGSVSGEHGIGLSKKPYLRDSRSADEVALMAALKKTLDPKSLLNRSRVVDIPA